MRSEVKINWTENFEVIMGGEIKLDLYMDGNKKIKYDTTCG